MCNIFDIFNIYLKVKLFKYAWILSVKRRFEPYSLSKQDHKILLYMYAFLGFPSLIQFYLWFIELIGLLYWNNYFWEITFKAPCWDTSWCLLSLLCSFSTNSNSTLLWNVLPQLFWRNWWKKNTKYKKTIPNTAKQAHSFTPKCTTSTRRDK